MSTKIEWANETWNPIIGCSKVSPGCDNCYAEKMAGRLANMPNAPDEYQEIVLHKVYDEDTSDPVGQWNGETRFVESALEKPIHWKKPRRIFVCSMGDLFHETVSLMNIARIWMVMSMCPQHTFLILTKRPKRMSWALNLMDFGILPNVHPGVTVENKDQLHRIEDLLKIPAAKRFVSIEPMLGPVNLLKEYPTGKGSVAYGALLDHVIVGGESGPKARPMLPDWVRSIRDQCQETGTPFLFKQWGEWLPSYQFGEKLYELIEKYPKCRIGKEHTFSDGLQMYKIGKKAAGRELDGKTWNEYPENF